MFTTYDIINQDTSNLCILLYKVSKHVYQRYPKQSHTYWKFETVYKGRIVLLSHSSTQYVDSERTRQNKNKERKPEALSPGQKGDDSIRFELELQTNYDIFTQS